MNKAWIEDRVRWLLDAAGNPWTYKPPDSAHAGPVKLDFLSVGEYGEFWAVEVKQTPNQGFYNPLIKGSAGISSLQRQALDRISTPRGSVVLVAVWADSLINKYGDLGKCCHIFDWRTVRLFPRWEWRQAIVSIIWSTKAEWLKVNLADYVYEGRQGT